MHGLFAVGLQLAVFHAAAAELGPVGGEDLFIRAGERHADAVPRLLLRREVDHNDDIAAVLGDTAEGDDVVAVVLVADPLKAAPVGVLLPELRRLEIEMVERLDIGLHLFVRRVIEQHPVQPALVGPFGELGELAAHEQHLLARVRGHVAVQRAQAAELVLIRGRHLADQRALAVHDLVVRKRQDVVFRERIHEREGDLVVHVLAEERVSRAVAQHIVHPAHVPLEVEPKAAVIARLGHHRPRGGLLGDHHDVRMVGQDVFVEQAQEVDRFQILAPAVDVGPPFVLAVVVQIQHGGDRVHAQAVHVEFLDPEHRGREQQVAGRNLAVVEYARAPFLVLHLERVGVFVEVRAVELHQAAAVLGEVRGHPVHDHADAGLMRLVDQIHEVFRRAVAACRGEVADDLIAPRAVERVLGQRHELDVGVAHLLDIGHQLVRQLAVGVEVAVLMHLPRAEVALVDIDRARIGQVVFAPVQPGGVVPLVPLDVIYLGGVARAGLGVEAVRVGLVEYIARFCPYTVFICGIFGDMRDEFFPDALLVAHHVVCFAVPAVEFAHDRNLFRFGRIYAEQIALLAVLREGVRAHIVKGTAVPARIEKLAALFTGRRCGFLLHIASLPLLNCQNQGELRIFSNDFVHFARFRQTPFTLVGYSIHQEKKKVQQFYTITGLF